MNDRDMNERDDANPKLDALIGALPRAIEPPRNLWPAVNARIALQDRQSGPWELAAAAVFAAVTVAAMFVGFSHDAQPRVPAPLWAYEQLDSAYKPLRQASLERYRAGAGRLDPELRKTVEANLAIIERALAEIRTALASRPSDAALGQMLQRTYDQELAIVDAVTPRQMSAPDQSHYRGAL
jgi:hypothetical protein